MRSLTPGPGDARDDVVGPPGSQALKRGPRPRPPRGVNVTAGADRPLTAGLDFTKYVAILRERWRIIAIAFVTVTAGVALGDAAQRPVYRATGTIEIRKQSAEVVPVEALFQFERISDQYLQTQYAMLQSPTLVRRTLSDTMLARRFQGQRGRENDRNRALPLDALVDNVRKRLTIQPVAGSRIVRVSFEASDAAAAAAFVNALVAQYIAMREEAGIAALQRLAEQADSVRSRVVQAESNLQRFVQENDLGIVVGGAGQLEATPNERLRRLEQELTLAETETYRVEAQYDAVQDHASAAIDSDLLRTLRARIAELQGEYARLRSAFTDSYPRARQLRSELAQLDSLVLREQERVSSAMSSQWQATERRRELLQAAVNEQRRLMDRMAAKEAEYDRLKRDLDGQKQLHMVLQQKRKESAVAASLAAMDVAVLDAAAPPAEPVRPVPTRDVPLAAIAGLMLGLGLAVVRAHSDVTVRTLDEVEGLTRVPVLALIPATRVLPRELGLTPAPSRVVAGGKRYSIDLLAEAFRGLRTSVLFESRGPVPRTLLVTSAAPGDGKTFVSTNLALSLAALGHRVLLIDADLRRPSVHRAFGLKVKTDLSKNLAAAVPWRESITPNVAPGLDILASRSVARNASDLLSSGAIRALLTEARSIYDFVLLDAPALFLNVPDARILAPAVEGVLVVVRSGSTPRDVVRRLLAHTPNVVGLVINRYDLRHLPSSYADYGERVATVPNSAHG